MVDVDTLLNARWCNHLVEQFAQLGVEHAVIAPGSRSTPMTLALLENSKIKTSYVIDERSCAFFGLGVGKASHKPCLVLCTSGSALTHFFPAVVEACHSMVPLIVISTDRPPEFQQVIAAQTINQANLYGSFAQWFFDVGMPEDKPQRFDFLSYVASRAAYQARRGVVHLNMPFRKPLHHRAETKVESAPHRQIFETQIEPLFEPLLKNGSIQLDSALLTAIKKAQRGLITVGAALPSRLGNLQHVIELAEHLNWPVLADASSGLFNGQHSKRLLLNSSGAVLRIKKLSQHLQPDFILHFGTQLTATETNTWYEALKDMTTYHVNEYPTWPIPCHRGGQIIAKPKDFCHALISDLPQIKPQNAAWFDRLLVAQKLEFELIKQWMSNCSTWFEGKVLYELGLNLPADRVQVVANSMPIRWLNFFTTPTNTAVQYVVNRGANGIDGLLSMTAGLAWHNKVEGIQKPVIAITGDLGMLHDSNALEVIARYKLAITIIIINNQGGGIFSLLPSADLDASTTEYLYTPPSLKSFQELAQAYKLNYSNPKNWLEFQSVIQMPGIVELFTQRKHIKPELTEVFNWIDTRINDQLNL